MADDTNSIGIITVALIVLGIVGVIFYERIKIRQTKETISEKYDELIRKTKRSFRQTGIPGYFK